MPPPYGMSDAALYPYLLAMREELYIAQRADERLRESIQRWLNAAEEPNGDLFAAVDAEQDMLGAVELLLTAHARLSLYLFPAYDRPPARGRAKAIRSCLGVANDHPIGSREARNAWMHIDEEVDRAVFERAEEFVEAYRVVRKGWPSAKRPPRSVLTVFNVDSLVLHIAGHKHNIKELIRHVDHIGIALFRAIPDVEHRLDLAGAAHSE